MSNGSSQPSDWQVTVAVDRSVTQTWNATVVNSAPGLLTAGGVSWNDILAPGATTSFGFCAARGGAAPTATRTATRPPTTSTRPPYTATSTATLTRVPATATRPPSTATATVTRMPLTPTATTAPTAGVSAQVSPFNDWGAGYCANVVVSTTSDAPIDWRISFPIDGHLRELWNAAYGVAGNTITAEGLSWNSLVTRAQPVTFGFCALR